MSKVKTSSKSKPSNDNEVNQSSKIDAIKELIFGENIQEYNSEFQAVRNDLNNKKKELENLIDETRDLLTQSIDSLSTDLNIRITEVEDAFNEKLDNLNDKKLDRKQFGKLLMTLGEKISE
ncbi:MAG: fructose 1,6-bisphosphatase [Winogradskyella sp.]|nr:MAG: fructose 1,6-bisphosphatase [Winogradskyella sp.]